MHCLKGYSTIIHKIILGQMCLLCSTLNFLNLYGTAPGTVRPATLVSCLPQISSQIQTGQQQCSRVLQSTWTHCKPVPKSAFNSYQLQPCLSAILFLWAEEWSNVLIMQQYYFYYYNGNNSPTTHHKGMSKYNIYLFYMLEEKN